MSTLFGESLDGGKSSIVDDFMFGSNVASSHTYIRLGFLRKVYGILSAQLAFTTLIGLLFIAYEPIRPFIKENDWLVIVLAVSSLALIVAMPLVSKRVPHNYILLSLFTLCESLLIGCVVLQYEVASVMEAFALTSVVLVSLTLFTCQTKRDFSSWGAGLYSALVILIVGMFLQLLIGGDAVVRLLSLVGALIFSLYIIYDTQQIMLRVSPEEYIHAATILYLDIINLFLHILRAIGRSRE